MHLCSLLSASGVTATEMLRGKVFLCAAVHHSTPNLVYLTFGESDNSQWCTLSGSVYCLLIDKER